MRLTKLEMKNFGPYKGVVEVSFDSVKGKNVWIIWGSNGAGKTHVFKAIKWCLYGWEPSPGEKIRRPTSKDAWDLVYGTNIDQGIPPDPYMHVCLWFEHQPETASSSKQLYVVRRLVRPASSRPRNPSQIDVDFEVKINGRINDSPKEAIEAILPVAANQFFMFHGEEIRKMSLKHGEDVQQAIELILDAQTFRQGIAHLATVGKQISRELDEERAKAGDMAQYLDAKHQIEEKTESIQKEITQNQRELEAKREDLENVDAKLRSHQGSEKLMGQLEIQRQQLNQVEEDRENHLAKYDVLISELPSRLILPELQKVLEKKEVQHQRIEEQRQRIAELRGMQMLAARVLKLDTCICGNKITGVEKTHLEAERRHYEDELKRSEAGLEQEDPTYYQVRETVAGLSASKLDFAQYKKELDRINVRIDEFRNAIKKTEKDLGSSDQGLIRQLQADRTGFQEEIARRQERVSSLREMFKTQQDYMDRVERNILRVDRSSRVKQNLERQFSLAQIARSSFESVLEPLTDIKRKVIEVEATRIFRKLTNKPEEYDRIQVDEYYDVAVVNKEGNLLEREKLSTGEREIVALSFILGLMRASEKEAPLVLDTFFAHLDDAHYTNIVSSLPDFAHQVVLILTNVEYQNLRQRASEGFFGHLAQVWQATRDQEKKASKLIGTELLAPISKVAPK